MTESAEPAMIRSHEAGTLRPAQAGERVTLAGWVARRRDHGGVVFIDLRDASGVVQVVFRGEGEDRPEHALRAEFCIRVSGEVRERPPGNENPDLPTGRSRSSPTTWRCWPNPSRCRSRSRAPGS